MRVRISAESVHNELVRRVEEYSGQDLMACYQCGKCAAGCPVAFAMDMLPSQVIRYAQLGLVAKLLERRGFAVKAIEDSRGYVVKLSRKSRYSWVLKNSLARIENDEWRIFLMKDEESVKEALKQGAKLVEVDVRF